MNQVGQAARVANPGIALVPSLQQLKKKHATFAGFIFEFTTRYECVDWIRTENGNQILVANAQ